MKNVLFATSALVAMTGTAFAAAHDSGSAGVSFSGSMTAGYNDVIEGGLFWEANVDLTASVDLGDNVTASATFNLADLSALNANFTPVLTTEIAYTGDSFSASLKFGDLGDKGASEYFYADRDGMELDVENHDSDSDVRALVEFGNFGVAVGCDSVAGGTCASGVNYGAGATFGSIELGVGYDDSSNGQSQVTGVSADATFGAFSVGVSYISGNVVQTYLYDSNDTAAPLVFEDATATDAYSTDSTGIEIGYDISDAISVGAYYAMNGTAGDSYGVSVSYSAGALGVSAFYDVTGEYVFYNASTTDADGDGSFTRSDANATTETTEFGADLDYAVTDMLTAYAGVLVSETTSTAAVLASPSATYWYVGAEYAVNDNITATLSYSEGDEVGGPEFKDGISAFITASF